MPKSTGVGIYISIFATVGSFAFVWDIVWLIIVSIIGIIVTFIIRGFSEDSSYTLPAAKVEQIEVARVKKTKAPNPNYDQDEDMGLVELIKFVYVFTLGVIKSKGWRTWR